MAIHHPEAGAFCAKANTATIVSKMRSRTMAAAITICRNQGTRPPHRFAICFQAMCARTNAATGGDRTRTRPTATGGFGQIAFASRGPSATSKGSAPSHPTICNSAVGTSVGLAPASSGGESGGMGTMTAILMAEVRHAVPNIPEWLITDERRTPAAVEDRVIHHWPGRS